MRASKAEASMATSSVPQQFKAHRKGFTIQAVTALERSIYPSLSKAFAASAVEYGKGREALCKTRLL